MKLAGDMMRYDACRVISVMLLKGIVPYYYDMIIDIAIDLQCLGLQYCGYSGGFYKSMSYLRVSMLKMYIIAGLLTHT